MTTVGFEARSIGSRKRTCARTHVGQHQSQTAECTQDPAHLAPNGITVEVEHERQKGAPVTMFDVWTVAMWSEVIIRRVFQESQPGVETYQLPFPRCVTGHRQLGWEC